MHCLVEEWKDSGPSRNKSGFFMDKKSEEYEGIVQSGVRKQTGIDVCDVEEEASTHEDSTKMYRTKILVKKVWGNGEGATWEVMTWSEEWTGRERF